MKQMQESEKHIHSVDPARSPGEALARVLELLACPACYEPVTVVAEGVGCAGCGRVYSIVDGIPVLLVDRAQPAR